MDKAIERVKKEVRINSYYKVDSTDQTYGIEQKDFPELILRIIQSGEFISYQENGHFVWSITKNPNYDLNNSAKLNNRWTPIIAGVTVFISIISLTNQYQQSKRDELKQQLLLRILTTQDSTLKTLQKKIDYLEKYRIKP